MSVMVGLTAMAWSVSADREHRDKMPEVGKMQTTREERRECCEVVFAREEIHQGL